MVNILGPIGLVIMCIYKYNNKYANRHGHLWFIETRYDGIGTAFVYKKGCIDRNKQQILTIKLTYYDLEWECTFTIYRNVEIGQNVECHIRNSMNVSLFYFCYLFL